MRDLDFTGERVVPGKVDPELEVEHRARYAFAASYVRDRRVLDYGCGAGYGASTLMRAGARRVVGIDWAPEAISFAAAHFGGPGVAFCVGDCLSSPLRREGFDVVVAYEVIEHVDDHRQFLAEVRRLLSPGGVFLVSTPNKKTYREDAAGGPNPFHVHELDLGELRGALAELFPVVALFGQCRTEGAYFYTEGHGGAGLADGQLSPIAGEGGEAAGRLESADSLLALCGADRAALGAAPTGDRFLVVDDNAVRRRNRRIVELQTELEERTRWALQLQAELEGRTGRVAAQVCRDRLPCADELGREQGEAERRPGEGLPAPEVALAGLRPGQSRPLVDDEWSPASPKEAPKPAFPDGHFYSPVIDPADIGERSGSIWPAAVADSPAVDYRSEAQRSLLPIVARYAVDFDYPQDWPDPARGWFYERNGKLEGLDARMWFCLLRHFRPRRVIEVGGGFSTLLAADVNHRFLDGCVDVVCIEPHPPPFLQQQVPGLRQLVVSKVQDVPTACFELLEAGDVLFIDSSHVSKTGSDVNALYFRILPALRQGVLLHIHDIFLPEEYPREWVLGEQRSWNEQYVVHALLTYSHGLEIVFGCAYAVRRFPELVRESFGIGCGGASLWLRKIAAPGRLG